MTELRVRIPNGSTVPESFADITAAPLLSATWEGPYILLAFDGDLTVAQVRAVTARAMSESPDEEQCRVEAGDYLDAPLGTPTALSAQVDRLTRLVLRLTDPNEG